MKKGTLSLLAAALVGMIGAAAQASVLTVPSGYAVQPYITGVSPFAIAFSPGGTFGYDGQLIVEKVGMQQIWRVPSQGNMIYFTTSDNAMPHDIEFAPVGGSQYTEGLYEVNNVSLNRYSSAGAQTTITGVKFEQMDLAFGPGGAWGNKLYMLDAWGTTGPPWSIAKVDPNGAVTNVFSTSNFLFRSMTFGSGGRWGTDLYLGCTTGSLPGGIRRMTADGIVSDVALSAGFGTITSVAIDTSGLFNGDMFASEMGTGKIYRVDPNGQISVFATGLGSGTDYDLFSGDLRFGPDGALYVGDYANATVWRVVPEPGVLCLLALGGAALIRRRRNA